MEEFELKKNKRILKSYVLMFFWSALIMAAWNYALVPSLGIGAITYWQAILIRYGVRSFTSIQGQLDRIEKRDET